MSVPGRGWSSWRAEWRYASPLGEGERTKVRGLELLLLSALHRPSPSPSPSPGRGDPFCAQELRLPIEQPRKLSGDSVQQVLSQSQTGRPKPWGAAPRL